MVKASRLVSEKSCEILRLLKQRIRYKNKLKFMNGFVVLECRNFLSILKLKSDHEKHRRVAYQAAVNEIEAYTISCITFKVI